MKLVKHQTPRGFTLLEMLAVLMMSSILLTGLVVVYFSGANYYRDLQIRTITTEKARGSLETIAYDVRMLGAGMPIAQKSFLPGAALVVGAGAPLLQSPTLPILLDATTNKFTIRLNQKGGVTLLVDDFSPDARYDFYVIDDSVFKNGDKVFLSNMTQGKEDGLYGVIAKVSDNHISLNNNWAYSANALFPKGSTVNLVSDITYQSLDNGIIRIDEGLRNTVCDKAKLEVQYFSKAGQAISPPLTAANVRDDLASMRIIVTVVSEQKLSDGSQFEATASENIMLRNLVLTRTP